MRRREFIGILGSAAAWPVVAQAQQPMPLVGHMHAGAAEANHHIVALFEQGLRDAGYVNGQNVLIEYNWADGRYERLPAIAAELVRRQVAVLAAGTPVAAIAAKNATATIPIVFSIGGDPIRNGLVASLNRPGGNVTGATFFSNLLTGKRLALLRELVPHAKVFGALVNPDNANASLQTSDAEEAARAVGVELVVAGARNEGDLERSFNNLKQRNADAVVILSDSILNSLATQIAHLALQRALPTCFAYRRPAEAGGLMSYGSSNDFSTRQAGSYVGRILKGEKPADLPVQQPTKFEFVINMKTAKALGLAVPNSMQLLADAVIE